MNKELIDKAWACLPREFKEEVKRLYRIADSDVDQMIAMIMLENVFGHHNLTSYTEGEGSEELLTARRKVIQEAYAANERIKKEYPRGIIYKQSDAVNGLLWGLFGSKCLPDKEEKMTEKRYQYLNSLSLEDYDNETSADEQRQFCEYQHKHHPDEVIYLQTYSDEKPQPAEPKFKVGDDVRIVDDSRHGQKYRGDVTEVVYVDESDPDATYKVDIYDEECGVSLWYSESDLEPYTEPTANYMQVDYHGADTAASTIADSCQSQPVTDYFDRIIKDGFRGHNRLHIAAQIVAAIYANYQAAKGFKSIEEIVRKSLDIADTLIKESEKGGSK